MFAENFWHRGSLSWHGKNAFHWNYIEILDKMSKRLKYIKKLVWKKKKTQNSGRKGSYQSWIRKWQPTLWWPMGILNLDLGPRSRVLTWVGPVTIAMRWGRRGSRNWAYYMKPRASKYYPTPSRKTAKKLVIWLEPLVKSKSFMGNKNSQLGRSLILHFWPGTEHQVKKLAYNRSFRRGK